MQNHEVTSRSIRRAAVAGTTAAAQPDRRTRRRLRDLCDEVLASYRVARGRDLWSADERDEAERLLARLTPRLSH